jgi:hypothetical protein
MRIDMRAAERVSIECVLYSTYMHVLTTHWLLPRFAKNCTY